MLETKYEIREDESKFYKFEFEHNKENNFIRCEDLESRTNSDNINIFFLYQDDNGSLKGFNTCFHDDVHIRWNIGHTDNYGERIRTLFHEFGHAGNPLRNERENRLYTHTDYW